MSLTSSFDDSSDPIQFSVEDVDFSLENQPDLRIWINNVVSTEKAELASITYIFCSDDYLHKINMEYLNHDTYTDIITFSLSDTQIESDIFISIDRVKENAIKLGIEFEEELHRVMIHGILHLCGYKDKTEAEEKLMRTKENEALLLLPSS